MSSTTIFLTESLESIYHDFIANLGVLTKKLRLYMDIVASRAYLTCNLRDLCPTPSLASYFTAEVWVMIIATLIHVPLCAGALIVIDRVKSGGRICGVSADPDNFNQFLLIIYRHSGWSRSHLLLTDDVAQDGEHAKHT